jgi:hypothetical protein
MNRYERFVQKLGFINPRQGRTRASADDIVGLRFDDYDLTTVRGILGRPKLHRPDLFFYRLSKTQAILVDTARNRVLLANSKRAVAAFAKTVNN